MDYEFHEVANIFPMMSEAEFAGLVEDIRNNGQRDPIWIYQQKIIDGRNRYNACLEIGIDPVVNAWDEKGSLVDFVVSKNLHRRQLTITQRVNALKTAEGLREVEKQAANERKLASLKQNSVGAQVPQRIESGKVRDKLGKVFGVSGRTVQNYSRVEREGTPELVEAMKEEKISIRAAEHIARQPQKLQNELLQQHKENPRQGAVTKPKIIKRETTSTKELEPIAKVSGLLKDFMSYMENFERDFSNAVAMIPDIRSAKIDFNNPLRAYRNIQLLIEGAIKLKKFVEKEGIKNVD